jgi:hypothetical protein
MPLRPEATDPELAELVQILHQGHPNVLLIGSRARTEEVLRTIRQYLREPLAHWSPASAPDVPDGSFGTLVIHDVDACDLERQRRLLSWMDTRPGAVQVVSTTTAPLFPLVKEGAFLAGLFYWLNFVCLDMSTRPDRG